MAMFTTEAYLQEPAAQLIEALQLYSISLQVRRGHTSLNVVCGRMCENLSQVIIVNASGHGA